MDKEVKQESLLKRGDIIIGSKGVTKRYILLLAGTLLMGVAYKSIYDMVGMVTGGFTGIAIIVKNQTQDLIVGGIPLWVTNTVLNIPVFIAAYKIKGKEFVKMTAVGALFLTIYLAVLPTFNLDNIDLLLIAVFGGLINGIGIAMVLLAYATTGGTDMVAAIIQNYLKHYSVVAIMLILDGIIVVVGVFIFDIQKSLYAVIAIYVTTIVSDRVMDGLKFAKGMYIISENYINIAENIMQNVNRGVTILQGTGMFSNKPRPVIFCVVSKKESVMLKDIAKTLDPKAFVIVSDVREVLGEGFVNNSQ